MIWAALLNRYVIGGAAVLAVVAGFFVWLARHDANTRSRARSEIVAELNKAAEDLAHDAVEARLPALRPGSFARLREHYCSNCSPVLPGSNADLHR